MPGPSGRPALPKGLLYKGYYTTYFTERGRAVIVGILKHCLKDKGRAVLVDIVTDSLDKVNAFLATLKSARVDVAALASITIREDISRALTDKRVRTVALLTTQ